MQTISQEYLMKESIKKEKYFENRFQSNSEVSKKASKITIKMH